MAMHARWKRAGASNNTVLVVHCDGPVDPDRLRRALDRLLDLTPWPASRLRRPFPWGKLHWAAGPRDTLVAPPVRHHRVASPDALGRQIEAEINTAIDPRVEPPLRFVTIGTSTGDGVLLATWFHPLMDPRGGQNLLQHLADLDAPDGRLADITFVASPSRRPLAERGRLARQSLAHMRTLAPEPPVSPGRDLAAPGPVRFRPAAFVEPAPRRAMRAMPWRLAVVGKAMAELWRKRGLPDVPFLLPVSVDLRPRGEPGATFGNQLAFHFARFRPVDTDDVTDLARVLRRQLADAVKDGHIDANAVAMEFLQYRPLSRMLKALPWTSSGEIFSFNYADLAEVPSRLDRFMGSQVVNAFHVPAVLPRPGIGVFLNRCAGRENVVVSWVDGVVSDDEVDRVIHTVSDGMEWIEAR